MFGGIVADAACAADKQHHGWTKLRQDHRIMTGTAHQRAPRMASLFKRILHQSDKHRVTGRGSQILQLYDRQAQLAPLADGLNSAHYLVAQGIAPKLVPRAHIQQEGNLAWNHIGRARKRFDLANGCNLICLAFFRESFNLDHEFRRPGERITPEMHRTGSSMTGLAFNAELKSQLSRYAGNSANRKLLGFEHGSLFDMRFQVA